MLAGLLIVLTGCGHPPPPRAPREEIARPSFARLDRNRDQRIEEREIFHTMLRYYDAWDLDEDGKLTRSELNVGLTETWDTNGDGEIKPAELEAGAADWLPPAKRRFAVWDANGDGVLDRDEMRQGVHDTALFERFDRNDDGYVTDLELGDAMFAYWDANGDGSISSSEWNETGSAPS